jgi:hypothetical protein
MIKSPAECFKLTFIWTSVALALMTLAAILDLVSQCLGSK